MVSSLASSVDSSSIDRIAYNVRGRKLLVTFRAATYTYFDVPPEAYEAFIASPSKRAFFNLEIRTRYDFKARQKIVTRRDGRRATPYIPMHRRRPTVRP